MESNRDILTITKARQSDPNNEQPPWVVLVIDDNLALLKVTHNVLKHYRYNQRAIQVECAHSAKEGRALYQRFPDAAVILLDCVMETERAGLDFVKYIREGQNNREVQIILRTGQAGIAPEDEVLRGHDLNDYLHKSQSTASNLRNRITAYIRNYENLTTLIREREALAGTIAHEVKNPLGKVDYSLTRIRDVLAEQNQALVAPDTLDQLYHLTEIGQRAIQRSSTVVDTVLGEISNGKQNCDHFIAFSARKAIEDAINDYYCQDETHQQRISVAGKDCTLYGDPIRFSLILFNLFNNALCYVEQYPQLTINICIETDSEHNRIRVKDNGPGISSDKLVRIFDRFYTDGKANGAGLGLAYCRRAMQIFDGEITANSTLKNGCTFTLTFPNYEPLPNAEANLSASEHQNVLQGKTILIVDDEAFNRENLEYILKPYGVSIIECPTGTEALILIEKHSIDAVITDLCLLEGTGTALTSAIREGQGVTRSDGNKEMPIIAVTADPTTNCHDQFFTVGGNTLLNKPIVATELINTLCHLFNDDLSKNQPKELLDNKENSETPILIAAGQLHHDMTTPLLVLENYGRLFNRYLPLLISCYQSTSTLQNIPATMLKELSAFSETYLTLLQQCRSRHTALWPEIQQEQDEARQGNLLSNALAEYQHDWSQLHIFHFKLLSPTLPILINQYKSVSDSGYYSQTGHDTSLASRELLALTKAVDICKECSEKTLLKLSRFN